VIASWRGTWANPPPIEWDGWVDLWFFADAVIWVRVAAAYARDHVPLPALQAAIDAFDADVPDAHVIRNMVEHPDAMDQGQLIALKKKGWTDYRSQPIMWTCDPSTRQVTDAALSITPPASAAPGTDPITLRLSTAVDAARRLHNATMAALGGP
jgi:hypothetical protein